MCSLKPFPKPSSSRKAAHAAVTSLGVIRFRIREGVDMDQELETCRVFVVDDEAIIATTLAVILRHEGFETDSFTSPRDALKAWRFWKSPLTQIPNPCTCIPAGPVNASIAGQVAIPAFWAPHLLPTATSPSRKRFQCQLGCAPTSPDYFWSARSFVPDSLLV